MSVRLLLVLASAARGASSLDHMFDRPVQRKCEVLAVTSGGASTRSAADIEGAYMLAPGSLDFHFVYQRHLEEPGGNNGGGGGGGGGPGGGGEGHFNLHDHPRFLYYSVELPGWLLGPTLGGAADWVAAAPDPTRQGSSPHDPRLKPWRLNAGKKTAAAAPGGGAANSTAAGAAAAAAAAAAAGPSTHFHLGGPAAGLAVRCRDGAAESVAKRKRLRAARAKLPLVELDAAKDSRCRGFRRTGGCDPDGPALGPAHDIGCADPVPVGASGYCVCGLAGHGKGGGKELQHEWHLEVGERAKRHRVGCGHSVFRCADACAVRFPAVIGVSDERVFTGQFARNVLRRGAGTGDWLAPSKGPQHIDFDLGPGSDLGPAPPGGSAQAAAATPPPPQRPPPVSSVRFWLWQHSGATPRHCELLAAPALAAVGGDMAWRTVLAFELHSGGEQQVRIDGAATGPGGAWKPGPVRMRYWRLSIEDNHGAGWGTGFDALQFLPTPKPPPSSKGQGGSGGDACAKYTSCAACAFSKENVESKSAGGAGGAGGGGGGGGGGGVLCGWCASAKKCMAGDPTAPAKWTCHGAWAWNSCDAVDDAAADARCGAGAHGGSCGACNAAAGCSWCLSAMPAARCQAGGCRNWAPRSCVRETNGYLERVEHPAHVLAAARAAGSSRVAKERVAAAALAKEDRRLAHFVKLAAAIAMSLMVLSVWSLCRMCSKRRKTGVDFAAQYCDEGALSSDWVNAAGDFGGGYGEHEQGPVVPSMAGHYGTHEIYTDA